MRIEFALMLLCFFLMSLVVLADETHSGDKDEDQVKTAEDPRWGRKGSRRHNGKRPWPKTRTFQDQRYISDWPWNKRTATDGDEDWPWNKRTVKDLDKDWPWVKRKTSDLDKDWPWNKRAATDVDEDWPWNKRTAKDLDKDQKFFDWPWSKRKANGIDNGGENLEDDLMKLTS